MLLKYLLISSFSSFLSFPFLPISREPCPGVFWGDLASKSGLEKKDPPVWVNGLANDHEDASLPWMIPVQRYWLRKWLQGSAFSSTGYTFRSHSYLGQNKSLLQPSTLHPNRGTDLVFLAPFDASRLLLFSPVPALRRLHHALPKVSPSQVSSPLHWVPVCSHCIWD